MTVQTPQVRSGTAPAIDEWIEQFHRDGYLVVQDVLPTDLIEQLKSDLDAALGEPQGSEVQAELQLRMFERSQANLHLFDREPIVTFAERLIGDDRPKFGKDHVHVIHNNSFRTRHGQGISDWHQDEPPYYVVTDGRPPANVRLPVLLFTCNYYLTDVTEPEQGPTEFIPGSHLYGSAPPENLTGTQWEDRVMPAYGKAGTAVMFTCQTWHRGSPNHSGRVRYVTQVSYAHRTIGHRYYPFMNYVLPEHVLAQAEGNPRLKRLIGFVPAGPYG
jgi:ectoine hydroxylase-related dioxygenase (phytanoyl-CoA dioxygenase family)